MKEHAVSILLGLVFIVWAGIAQASPQQEMHSMKPTSAKSDTTKPKQMSSKEMMMKEKAKSGSKAMMMKSKMHTSKKDTTKAPHKMMMQEKPSN